MSFTRTKKNISLKMLQQDLCHYRNKININYISIEKIIWVILYDNCYLPHADYNHLGIYIYDKN